MSQDSNKKIPETDDSISFSMTPPVLQENKQTNDNSDESISEHLTLNSGGTENDRSFQEIEISYQPSLLLNIATSDEETGNISQEKLVTLEPDVSDHSGDEEDPSIKDNECVLGNSDGPKRVCSILEEMLCNEQLQSDHNLSVEDSKEESINIFGNVNLDDQALSRYKHDLSLNEQNLYASDFQLPLLKDGHDIEKRMRDFEELIAVKDSTIVALTSELDAVRETSHTNTGSTLSTTEYKQLQEECHNKVSTYCFVTVFNSVT